MNLTDDFELKFTRAKSLPGADWRYSNACSMASTSQPALQSWPLPQLGSNRGYRPEQVIEQMIVSVWYGAARFVHADITRLDATQMQTQSYRWFFAKVKLPAVTLDLDSTAGGRRTKAVPKATIPNTTDAPATTRYSPLLRIGGWPPTSGCALATPVQPTTRMASSKRRLRIWEPPRLGCFAPTAAFTSRPSCPCSRPATSDEDLQGWRYVILNDLTLPAVEVWR